MKLQRTIDPTVEPVTLAQARLHLRVGAVGATAVGITQADPGVVTSPSHGLADGDTVTWTAATGMVELDGNIYTATYVSDDTFSIAVNTTGFTASDGTEAYWPNHPDDVLIEDLITASREHCEKTQQRAYITQTWVMKLDAFPGSSMPSKSRIIEIPRPRLQSITHIKYKDTDGVEQTLDTSVYVVSTFNDQGGSVSLAHNQSWPTVLSEADAVTITFVAGYGDTAAKIPKDIISAIKLILGDLYEHREAQVDIGDLKVNRAVESLLARDAVVTYA